MLASEQQNKTYKILTSKVLSADSYKIRTPVNFTVPPVHRIEVLRDHKSVSRRGKLETIPS